LIMPRTDTLSARPAIPCFRPLPLVSLKRRFLLFLVRKVEYGQLLFHLPSGETIQHSGRFPGPSASVTIYRWRAVRRMLLGGDVGFAESYIDGDWSTPALTTLIELVARNYHTMVPAMDGSRLARMVYRISHLRHNNTKRGSRRNIPAHYDLGNSFYAAWLDTGMTYSSGLYENPDDSLEHAQNAKQRLVIDSLALSGGERVLEIGCGWGGLAERLARENHCHVIGLTLSPAQIGHARGRISASCLENGSATGSVELHRLDYRDIEGTFDRVVSIEMLEAVGKEYWPTYFATVRDRLRPGGIAILQVITMAEDRYATYERGTDFIQRHIFPGGMLPSETIMRTQIEAARLWLDDVRTFGASYARTLADWQSRFQRAWPRLRPMGFDERFRRKWEYYLSYCEAGFRAGAIDVGMYRLRRPLDDGTPDSS
jgi:cyclopropane-fatty-acyl-phospholipid synthase